MKYLRIVLFMMLCMFACHLAEAQQRKSNPRTNQSKFVNDLWYGANANLQFGGGGSATFFGIGLAPMIGYKITPEFSIGPRVGFTYTNHSVLDRGNTLKANLFDFTEAVFVRYKIFRAIFAHGEYGIQQYQDVIGFNNITNKFDKAWFNTENAYLGLGYNAGTGSFATEISMLYNFLNGSPLILQNFEYRIGLTYNF